MLDTRQFSQPVRRSLLQRDLMGGVPMAGLLLLVVLTVFFVVGLELYLMLVPIIVLYLVMRALTKKDPWMIDIILENIMQKDRLIP